MKFARFFAVLMVAGLVQACGSDDGSTNSSNDGVHAGSGGAGGTAGGGGSVAGAGGFAGSPAGGSGGIGGGGSGGDEIPVGGSGGTAGTAGSAGAAGTGGTAGSAGTAGTGGTAGTAGSAGAAGTGGAAGMAGGGSSGESCLQGGGDYSELGPYSVGTTDVEIGSQGLYTLFYPEPLDENCKHPIVAWGNGTTVTGSGTYAFYNEHAASYGIVVAASHNSNVGSGDFHKAAIDYLLAENENQDSMFYGKLSDAAGVSGHSQGGAGANAGAAHPNVSVEVNVQGSFGTAPPDVAFLCLTGTEDINPEGCKTAVDGASSPAMHANWDGGDHIGTATVAGFIGGDPGTMQYRRLYTAWFRCFLDNDQNACAMFQGGMDCPVCNESGWAEIYSNNF